MVTETLAVVGISLWGIMKNVELKQQAIAYIERLSTEKLEVVLDYLAALESSDLWATEAESEALKSSDKAEPLLALAGTLECEGYYLNGAVGSRKSARCHDKLCAG